MKTLVTVIALSAATIFSAQAQETKKSAKDASRMEKVQPEQDMSKQVMMHTEKMTKDLGLTSDQNTKLMSENKMLYANMAEMRMSGVEGTEADAMTKKTIENYDARVKNILNDEQYKKYSSMKDGYMKDITAQKMDKKRADRSVDTKEDMRRK